MSKAPAPRKRDTREPELRANGATTPPARMLVERTLRRTRDVTVAGISLILLAPLLVVVAILVILDSPGPLLCSQPRNGRGGRTFKLSTFRTTVRGSEITPIGSILQRYALDKIPLLWNVFVGDLSLIILWRNAQTFIIRSVGAQ